MNNHCGDHDHGSSPVRRGRAFAEVDTWVATARRRSSGHPRHKHPRQVTEVLHCRPQEPSACAEHAWGCRQRGKVTRREVQYIGVSTRQARYVRLHTRYQVTPSVTHSSQKLKEKRTDTSKTHVLVAMNKYHGIPHSAVALRRPRWGWLVATHAPLCPHCLASRAEAAGAARE